MTKKEALDKMKEYKKASDALSASLVSNHETIVDNMLDNLAYEWDKAFETDEFSKITEGC